MLPTSCKAAQPVHWQAGINSSTAALSRRSPIESAPAVADLSSSVIYKSEYKAGQGAATIFLGMTGAEEEPFRFSV